MIDPSLSISLLPYLLTLMAALAAGSAILWMLMLQDSDENTGLARAYQVWRLTHTRIVGMLKHRQIDPASYLRAASVVDLKAQIARCHACTSKALCDEVLSGETSSASDFSFCPSRPAIDRLLVVARRHQPA